MTATIPHLRPDQIAAVNHHLNQQPDAPLLRQILGLEPPTAQTIAESRRILWCATHNIERVKRAGVGNGMRCTRCDAEAKQRAKRLRSAQS